MPLPWILKRFGIGARRRTGSDVERPDVTTLEAPVSAVAEELANNEEAVQHKATSARRTERRLTQLPPQAAAEPIVRRI